MYLLQSLIIFAVVASNIDWQRTPNPYLASSFMAVPSRCTSA
jgi:hypothetical protein